MIVLSIFRPLVHSIRCGVWCRTQWKITLLSLWSVDIYVSVLMGGNTKQQIKRSVELGNQLPQH